MASHSAEDIEKTLVAFDTTLGWMEDDGVI